MIAIDNGIVLVMAENLQTGFVWQKFMGAREVRRAMQLAGFTPNDQRRDASVASAPRGRDSTAGE